MRIELLIKKLGVGDSEGLVLRFIKASCIIGRKNGDIALEDPRCSRQHAMLFETGAGLLAVKHLGTTNGTYVNGEKVDSIKTLAANDRIRVGETVIVVVKFTSVKVERVTDPVAEVTQISEPKVFSGWPNSVLALPEDERKQFQQYFTFAKTKRA